MANVRGVRIPLNGGVNLSDPPSELQPGELSLARNCFYLPEGGQLTKMPGRQIFSALGNPAMGLSFVKFRSGLGFLIGASGTSYATVPTDGGSFTARATGLSPVGRMMAAYYQGTDRAYVSDGYNAMRVWTGSGDMRTAGLTSPQAATVTFLNNSATLYASGVSYFYCHTEYDSVNDVESGPSPARQNAATAANGTFKYALPALTNPIASADRIRVYRTQSGGNIFYRIAEFASTNVRYYDGDDTESLGLAVDNDTASPTFGSGWGHKTVEDGILTTQTVMPMVGEPLRGNYMTVNGTVPIGGITGVFQGSLYVSGVAAFPQHLYFSLPDFPESFSPVNFIAVENGRGDPITGCGEANDSLIIFTVNSIHRLNTFPRPTDPGFGLGVTFLEEVTKDHGCVAKRSIVNFGVGQPNNRAFYLSTRGPMMTDGDQTYPLNEDMDWSPRLVNQSAMSGAIAVNFPKYQQVWLFCPSKNSTTNDIAFIYHYHPNHVKYGAGVGKWTAPAHIRCGAAAVVYDTDTETRLFTADTNSSGNVYQEDTGDVDESYYDDSTGKINWEWMTGDWPVGEETLNKRVQRVHLNVQGTDSFTPSFKYAVNKADQENQLVLANITNNQGSLTSFGTSNVIPIKTRTYRAGVWQTGSHFRWHMQETAIASRSVVTMEAEIEEFGRQR